MGDSGSIFNRWEHSVFLLRSDLLSNGRYRDNRWGRIFREWSGATTEIDLAPARNKVRGDGRLPRESRQALLSMSICFQIALLVHSSENSWIDGLYGPRTEDVIGHAVLAT